MACAPHGRRSFAGARSPASSAQPPPRRPFRPSAKPRALSSRRSPAERAKATGVYMAIEEGTPVDASVQPPTLQIDSLHPHGLKADVCEALFARFGYGPLRVRRFGHTTACCTLHSARASPHHAHAPAPPRCSALPQRFPTPHPLPPPGPHARPLPAPSPRSPRLTLGY